MTPPPINIDGTDITGATIDGTDVSEVTVDGTQVFSVSAIPDSVDYRLKMDESSGTTLSPSIGSTTATLSNGGTWVNDSKYTGGTAPSFDAANSQYWALDSNIDINGSDFSALIWTDYTGSGDSTVSILGTFPSDTTIFDSGWQVFKDGSNTELGVQFGDGSIRTDVIRNATIPDISQNDLFVSLAVSGNTGVLRVYDSNGKQTDVSGSATRDQTADSPLLGVGGDSLYSDGQQDDLMLSRSTQMSESEIEQAWEATKR